MPFDFAAVSAPFRMQPGLRRIEPGTTQLTPNTLVSPVLREKLAVLTGHAPQALLVEPGFDPTPALRELIRHAANEHPDALGTERIETVHAHRLGWSLDGAQVRGSGPREIGVCLNALPAHWRLPALLSLAFAEDFAVLDATTGHIAWLAVCLPSHWAPETKVGRHFTEVHAPVADNALLIAAADPLVRLVTGNERWERFVWTFSAGSRLDAHPRRAEPSTWPEHCSGDELASRTYLRTERQTFIPVPGLRQAVFTIHVEVQPLMEAVGTGEAAARLHAALASMSPAVLAYRRLTAVREPLLEWLSRQAARSAR